MGLTEGATAALDFINAAGRPSDEITIEEARAALLVICDELSAEPEAVWLVQDCEVPRDSGPVRVRVYRPAPPGDGALHPLVVMMHGGGWVRGDLDTHDWSARSLCNAAPAVVVAVDYRRSPEHRFPAALDDTYAVVSWASENAVMLGADPGRVVVAGDSAGGNLAAAVAMLGRDRQGPAIAGQILLYPALDARCNTASCTEFRDGYFLTLEKLRWYWQQYLPEGDGGANPLMSPLRADDLSGLPPALVITAEFDPLRDEGEAFAEQLQEAGVPATAKRYNGLIHAFTLMSRLIPEAQDAIEDCGDFIRNLPRRAVFDTSKESDGESTPC